MKKNYIAPKTEIVKVEQTLPLALSDKFIEKTPTGPVLAPSYDPDTYDEFCDAVGDLMKGF